jgi:hypothetical protein
MDTLSKEFKSLEEFRKVNGAENEIEIKLALQLSPY